MTKKNYIKKEIQRVLDTSNNVVNDLYQLNQATYIGSLMLADKHRAEGRLASFDVIEELYHERGHEIPDELRTIIDDERAIYLREYGDENWEDEEED